MNHTSHPCRKPQHDSSTGENALAARSNGHLSSTPRPAPEFPPPPWTLPYLPPYSPDLNPIEQVFAKLKALVRAEAPRTVDTLWETIGACLSRFSPAECANYFANSGYPRLM